ncbi:MAG: hypothetical protein WCQ62_07895, partial [Sphaerochaeta sp.]
VDRVCIDENTGEILCQSRDREGIFHWASSTQQIDCWNMFCMSVGIYEKWDSVNVGRGGSKGRHS